MEAVHHVYAWFETLGHALAAYDALHANARALEHSVAIVPHVEIAADVHPDQRVDSIGPFASSPDLDPEDRAPHALIIVETEDPHFERACRRTFALHRARRIVSDRPAAATPPEIGSGPLARLGRRLAGWRGPRPVRPVRPVQPRDHWAVTGWWERAPRLA